MRVEIDLGTPTTKMKAGKVKVGMKMPLLVLALMVGNNGGKDLLEYALNCSLVVFPFFLVKHLVSAWQVPHSAMDFQVSLTLPPQIIFIINSGLLVRQGSCLTWSFVLACGQP